MNDLSIARQDALLKGRSFVRPHVMSVQATSATWAFLKLAGVSRPQRHGFYEVPVKRDSFGRLHLDRSAEQVRDSYGRLVDPGEIANLAALHETTPEVISVEVRQFEVELWVPEIGYHKTFRVAATSRWEALTKASSLAKADSVPMDLPATYQTRELVPAPRMPEKLVSRAIRDASGVPFAVAEYAADPPTRRFRVEVRADETWLSALIIDAPDETAAHDEALMRASALAPHHDFDVWSITEEDQVTEDEDEQFPAAVAGSAAGLPESGSVGGDAPGGAAAVPADPGSSRRTSPAFAATSPRGEIAEPPPPARKLSRIYKLRLAPDRVGFVKFYAFQDERLPSPLELPDLRESPPVSHLEVREMITRLHLAEDLSPLAAL